ncbi:MAG: YkgJ family cysteine cluster protein [Candidatus Helarchaeota archaeon]|nr:YkgJ family cysteine cluster protein [Candidatus Helarchaeota archaeon]
MLLANEDVERIKTQLNKPRQDFSYLRDGYIFLKNKDNYCVFLDSQTKRCSIYEIRPKGCQFYPIIYDPLLKNCVIDRDCTNKENVPKNIMEITCPAIGEFILLLERERNNRLHIKSQQKRK